MAARRTPQRQVILRTVKFAPQPLAAEEVFRRVRRVSPGIGSATVYRNLQALVKSGEMYRVESGDGIRRFVGHAYHRVIFTCQRCGETKARTTQVCPDYASQALPGDRVVAVSEMMMSGLCADCAKTLQQL